MTTKTQGFEKGFIRTSEVSENKTRKYEMRKIKQKNLNISNKYKYDC